MRSERKKGNQGKVASKGKSSSWLSNGKVLPKIRKVSMEHVQAWQKKKKENRKMEASDNPNVIVLPLFLKAGVR